MADREDHSPNNSDQEGRPGTKPSCFTRSVWQGNRKWFFLSGMLVVALVIIIPLSLMGGSVDEEIMPEQDSLFLDLTATQVEE